ncbi:MAG TPA: hypothetical protein VGL83_03755 [Stellaceae bacterium]|jgi:hypothetical protein
MKLRYAGMMMAATMTAAIPMRAAEYLAPIDRQRSYSSGVVTEGGKAI